MKTYPWTQSLIEEVICVLWTIAACCAWIAGFHIFACILFFKAFIDAICAIAFAVIAILKKKGGGK